METIVDQNDDYLGLGVLCYFTNVNTHRISYYILTAYGFHSVFESKVDDLKNPLTAIFLRFGPSGENTTAQEIKVEVSRGEILRYDLRGNLNIRICFIPINHRISSNITFREATITSGKNVRHFFLSIPEAKKWSACEVYEVNDFRAVSRERTCCFKGNAPAPQRAPFIFDSNGNVIGILTERKNDDFNELRQYICTPIDYIFKESIRIVESEHQARPIEVKSSACTRSKHFSLERK